MSRCISSLMVAAWSSAATLALPLRFAAGETLVLEPGGRIEGEILNS